MCHRVKRNTLFTIGNDLVIFIHDSRRFSDIVPSSTIYTEKLFSVSCQIEYNISNKGLAPVPITDMQTPDITDIFAHISCRYGYFWRNGHVCMKYAHCAMCWNEWKNNLPNFISWIIVKINRKLTIFRTKMTITRKIKIGKIWNLLFLLMFEKKFVCMQKPLILTCSD